MTHTSEYNQMMFSDIETEESVEIEVFDGVADADIRLSEDGQIDVEFEKEVEVSEVDIKDEMSSSTTGKMYDFVGSTSSGELVEFFNVSLHPMMKMGVNIRSFVKGIRPSQVLIDSTNGSPFIDDEVTIEIDMLNFDSPLPYSIRTDGDPLLERSDMVVESNRLDDIDERVDLIKEYRRPLRTGTIQITQSVDGTPAHQFDEAIDNLAPIFELLAFLQGVYPSPIRAQITEISGEEADVNCQKWVSDYKSTIGHAYKGEKIARGGTIPEFLDDAYDEYVGGARDRFRLNMAISWYLDSLVGGRTLDSKFASVCSGIELLAKRHSDLGPQYSTTENRIRHLVETLDVEVRDLAEFSDSFEDSKLEDDEYENAYFYYQTRQFVMHGDNLDTTVDELFRDYVAGTCLFRRLLRNQLIGAENADQYPDLSELEAEDTRYET